MPLMTAETLFPINIAGNVTAMLVAAGWIEASALTA
jgi:hypothetical protein